MGEAQGSEDHFHCGLLFVLGRKCLDFAQDDFAQEPAAQQLPPANRRLAAGFMFTRDPGGGWHKTFGFDASIAPLRKTGMKAHRLQQFDDYWIAEDEEGDGKALVLLAPWSTRYLEIVKRHQIKIIRLNDRLGWSGDISFVAAIPGIHGVDLISEKVTDVSPVFEIGGLKTLSLFCRAKVAGDFLKLKKLQSVGLEWRPVYHSLFGLKSLRRINVLGFPHVDLTCWVQNQRATSLRLSSNSLQSLVGIERFPSLKRLHLYRCRNLKSLEDLADSSCIQVLHLAQCSGVDDLSPIARLRGLRILEIEDCHTIRSVAPLAQCKTIQRLQIAGNTIVADGDFSPLRNLAELKDVLLAHRKHYSHRAEELERK